MPEHFIVPRYNEPALEFDGLLLAEGSSKEEGSKRWQEARVYRTVTNKYVTEIVGVTTLPGEQDIRTVRVYTNPEKVRNGLYRKQGDRQYLTDLAFEVLEEAATQDPAIQVLDTERI